MGACTLLLFLSMLHSLWFPTLPIGVVAVRTVPPGNATGVGPNIDITSANDTYHRQQAEPTIAVDPRNPSIIVAGAQDYRLVAEGKHRWHGYYRSTDYGQTWSVRLLPGFPGDSSTEGLASPLQRFNATSDPVLAFDRSGTVYYAGISLNITSSGVDGKTSKVFVAKYVNDGADYAGVTVLWGLAEADKPSIAVDTTGGPYDGNIYLALDASFVARFRSVFIRSTDGGRTFSATIPVPAFLGHVAPLLEAGIFPAIAIDPTGNIYISSLGYLPNTGETLHYIQLSKLTDGGSTLLNTTIAVDNVAFIPSPLPGNGFRAFTIPQIGVDKDGIYLVWDDFRTGNSDILFARSLDSGRTWSTALRVNDVSWGQQFFPSIAVAGGIISIIWYDSRLYDGSTIQNTDVYYAQSSDDGASFSPNLRVTSVSFDPNMVLRTDQPGADQPFLGDYIEVAATPTAVYPIWTDNRDACDNMDPVLGCLDQDIFTATITPQARHDVAVTGLALSRNFTYTSIDTKPILVNMTVTNKGSTSETFDLTVEANTTIINTQRITLETGQVAEVGFPWNTTLLPTGLYKLSAQVSQVQGEVNLADNNSTMKGTFQARKAGDVNGDGNVDIDDLIRVWQHQLTTDKSSPCDIDNDGVVNLTDLILTWEHQFT